jgi:uncharacterized protein
LNNVVYPSPNKYSNPQRVPRDQTQMTVYKPSALHKVFIGPDGLRAGWGLLIFLALLGASFKGINAVGQLMHMAPKRRGGDDSPITLTFLFIAETLPIIAMLLATWIMSKIERRPHSVYGLGGVRKSSLVSAGFAWGTAFLSLLLFILWVSGHLIVEERLLFGAAIFRFGGLWLLGFLLAGLQEEYLNRGYLQFTLTRGLTGVYHWIFKTHHSAALGFWTTALILSVLFGLSHGVNPGESPIGLIAAGLAGMIFCLSLWRTGSLWWAIGFHASWDWAQSFIYGVSDSGMKIQHRLLATHPIGKPLMSGGTVGPEGSIFVLLVLVLVSLVTIVTLPRKKYGIPYQVL